MFPGAESITSRIEIANSGMVVPQTGKELTARYPARNCNPTSFAFPGTSGIRTPDARQDLSFPQ